MYKHILFLAVACAVMWRFSSQETEDIFLWSHSCELEPNQSRDFLLETRSHLNVTIIAQELLNVKSYTTDGKRLEHRAKLIKLREKLDFIEITNGPQPNRIQLLAYKQSKDSVLEPLDALGILVLMVIIIDGKSRLTAHALTVFFVCHLLFHSSQSQVAERVLKKYIA